MRPLRGILTEKLVRMNRKAYLCCEIESEGPPIRFLTCFNLGSMIDKSKVQALVEQWLEGKEYFLADLQISADDRIVVEIDHADGVWIDDCVDLSRFVENGLDREVEDFELEVGSAGIGQPFKVLRQYEIHEGDRVEVLTTAGRRMEGVLASVTPESFVLKVQEKQRVEGKKRPILVEVDVPLKYTDVKWTKYIVDFK